MSNSSDQNCDVHLRAEIELLKKALADKSAELSAMTSQCLQESNKQVELEDSVIAWQDRYDRLYESHKRVQKINQNLEDKLLKLVDRNSGERAQLTSDVATLSVRLAQANYNISNLQREIERYKADMSLAIQLLQCKSDSFVPQKITSLPIEMQSKVTSYMRLDTNSHSDSEGSTSGMPQKTSMQKDYHILPASDDSSPPPLCPFPPTAMVYSMRGLDGNQSSDQNQSGQLCVSPAIVAKFLEEELKARDAKHCETCQCANKDLTVLADIQKSYSVSTQTIVQGDEPLCVKCSSFLNSPSRVESPFLMKLVKSSDSVISETKSSVSATDSTAQNDKLFTPTKKENNDLMVNPILGHHRLCDRTNLNLNNMIHQTPQSTVNIGRNSISTPKSISSQNIKSTPIPIPNSNSNPIEIDAVSHKSNSVCNLSNCNASVKKTPECSTKPLKPEPITVADKPVVISNNDPEESSSKGPSSASKTPASHHASLTHGPGNGSTNSLWSRTSSKEGAKLFENFNRNLIKTIKAENPKMAGPRICALRIQNGSNNVFLDNAQGEVMPVIYTRRSRLLDEELDDEKDITTGNITINSMMGSSSQISMVMSTSSNLNNGSAIQPNHINKTDSEKFKEISSKDIKTDNKKLIINKRFENNAMNGSISGGENSKSCTQSSSISSEIDLQETAMLRRQQLNRVAEWVQNSSKISVTPSTTASPNSGVKAESADNNPLKMCLDNDSRILNDNNNRNSLGSNLINAHVSNQACINSNNVMYKTNMLSNNDNSQEIAQNNCNNDKLSPTSLSKLNNNLPQSDNDNDEMKRNLINSPKMVVKNTLNECMGGDDNANNIDHVLNDSDDKIDLAQMEYNVKQFLLKQNEWSIHNRSLVSKSPKTTSSLASPTASEKCYIASNDCMNINTENCVVKQPQRTETNL